MRVRRTQKRSSVRGSKELVGVSPPCGRWRLGHAPGMGAREWLLGPASLVVPSLDARDERACQRRSGLSPQEKRGRAKNTLSTGAGCLGGPSSGESQLALRTGALGGGALETQREPTPKRLAPNAPRVTCTPDAARRTVQMRWVNTRSPSSR